MSSVNANIKHVTTPLDADTINDLKAGDLISISGTIYTGRDAAHKRIYEALEKGEEPPFPMEDQIIYYVGPSPAKPGQTIGSCGPTTSFRMDPYTPFLLEHGLKGMIGKGPRSPEVLKAMVKLGAVYFAAVGGAAALIAKSVIEAEVVAYEDLGPEAVYKLTVDNFQCIVAVDCHGNDLYKFGPGQFRTKF